MIINSRELQKAVFKCVSASNGDDDIEDDEDCARTEAIERMVVEVLSALGELIPYVSIQSWAFALLSLEHKIQTYKPEQASINADIEGKLVIIQTAVLCMAEAYSRMTRKDGDKPFDVILATSIDADKKVSSLVNAG